MDFIMYLIVLLLSFEQVLNAPHVRRRKLQPTFQPTPTDITVHRGELAVLKCHIKNVGPKKVVWREESSDVPLTIGETIFSPESNMAIEVEKLSEDETVYDLLIKDVEVKHSGTYMCQVTASKTYAHYVTLTVLAEPARENVKSIILFGTEYVNQGDQIKLSCNVTGVLHAPVDVDWFFKGERIITSLAQWRDRTEILRHTKGKMYISQLVIDRSTLEDNGRFVCRSTGSTIDVESITVNVLSANKDNSKRVVSEEISQPGTGSYTHSAAVAFYHSSMTFIITLSICVLIALTSSSCTNFPTPIFISSKALDFKYDNFAHR